MTAEETREISIKEVDAVIRKLSKYAKLYETTDPGAAFLLNTLSEDLKKATNFKGSAAFAI